MAIGKISNNMMHRSWGPSAIAELLVVCLGGVTVNTDYTVGPNDNR